MEVCVCLTCMKPLSSWDGQIRTIETNESEADPLVGMGLLEGYELKIQAVAGGLVTITALP